MTAKTVQIRYFSWVRERIGHHQEELQTTAQTVNDLVRELREKGEGYDLAFEDMGEIRVALNQELCQLDQALDDVHEVAFFPPMTGG